MVNLNDFNQVAECVYKNERYSVRDNGAILRYGRDGKSPRLYDNIWTFGKPNNKGYMQFVSEVVHRIVAFAFLGDPPTEKHVVDHIDTNRQNNRPENLRWTTKLENILGNPLTLSKIIFYCEDIEVFLKDPSILSQYVDKDPNFSWMRTVTPEEAQISYNNMLNRTNKDLKPSKNSNGIGEWIFSNSQNRQSSKANEEFTTSLTSNAIQKKWKTPTEFPLCPQIISDNPLQDYANNLKIGAIFSKNKITDSKIEDFAISLDKNSICVIGVSTQPNPIKPFTLTQITFENSLFVHENQGSFFKRKGAEKYFTLALGKEWLGGEVDDDLS